MSFGSIVKKVLGIEHAVATLAGGLVPGLAIFDKLVTTVQNAIGVYEVNIPAEKSGALRFDAVKNDFNVSLEVAQAAAAATNHKLVYDEAAFQRGVSAQVTAYNEFKTVKDSFKLIPL